MERNLIICFILAILYLMACDSDSHIDSDLSSDQ